MAPKKKRVTKTKVKKKKWLTILAPASFDNKKLGETHVVDATQAVGKSVKANLMNLTGSFKKQNIQIRFDVNKVKEGSAYTYVTGFENTNSLLKRIVRKGRTKIEDSFLATTKDDYKVRVKPVVITLNRASKGAQSAVRALVKEKLTQMLAGVTFDKAVQDLIGYSFQRIIKETASGAHPVKTVEVRSLRILPASKKKKLAEMTDDVEEAKEVTKETVEETTKEVTKEAPVKEAEKETEVVEEAKEATEAKAEEKKEE